jgi:phosphoribosylanthranilate isomerase
VWVVVAEVKFCGLTRPEDAALARDLGATYTGVIFAGGPRLLSAERARDVLAPVAGTGVKRVGVFGQQTDDEILDICSRVALDVIQISYGVDRARRIGLRDRFRGQIWAVLHLRPGAARSDGDDDPMAWFDDGIEALVLDAAVPGQLGGTGVALDWASLAPEVRRLQQRGTVVLAGGLRPGNVAQAIALSGVGVVDVSSGVESAPGIKDPELMRAFALEARSTEVR